MDEDFKSSHRALGPDIGILRIEHFKFTTLDSQHSDIWTGLDWTGMGMGMGMGIGIGIGIGMGKWRGSGMRSGSGMGRAM
jgi:hypothetical protein